MEQEYSEPAANPPLRKHLHCGWSFFSLVLYFSPLNVSVNHLIAFASFTWIHLFSKPKLRQQKQRKGKCYLRIFPTSNFQDSIQQDLWFHILEANLEGMGQSFKWVPVLLELSSPQPFREVMHHARWVKVQWHWGRAASTDLPVSPVWRATQHKARACRATQTDLEGANTGLRWSKNFSLDTFLSQQTQLRGWQTLGDSDKDHVGSTWGMRSVASTQQAQGLLASVPYSSGLFLLLCFFQL